ncbi:hypothetical protein ACFHW2_18250 [Actinomadura sp. LOL_016]|uniref:hypothetical protein n=1 Tax=unclassified Actinomadura TaxID=2626254 RepID=UPI003A7FE6EB
MRFSRSLALAATAAAPLALGVSALPAHAAVTTWKVVNPAANGWYTAETTGPMTIKNEAGATLVTCSTVKQAGPMASGTSTGTTAPVGSAYTTVGSPCTRPDGTAATIYGNYEALNLGRVHYTATGYDAATGTTALTGSQGSPWGITIFAENCHFSFSGISASYDNDTRTLKYTSATAVPYPQANEDGSTGCPGVSADGEAVTFTGEFKVSPAIRITRTVA